MGFKSLSKYSVLFVVFLGAFLSSKAQQTIFSKGTITDTVICSKNKQQKYTLFLPEGYDSNRKNPIIIVADPRARGNFAIQNFIKAAEYHNFVVAASYNSTNGPYENNLNAIAHILVDVQEKLNIDENRIYLSGFSGGSRTSAAMITQNPIFAGVIACGAGFPADINYHPTIEDDFIYVGLIGDKDANYFEMFDLEKQLLSLDKQNTLRVFNGGHQWPSPDVILDAVDYLNLVAMKQNKIERDTSFLNFLLQKRMKQIDSLEQQGEILEAHHQYKSLIREFEGLVTTDVYQEKINTIERLKAYQIMLAESKSIRAREIELQDEFLVALLQIRIPVMHTDSLDYWWATKIKTLHKLNKSQDLLEQKMAARLLNLVSAHAIEDGNFHIMAKEYYEAEQLFKLAVKVNPTNFYYYYKLASIESLNGNTKAALKALKKAKSLGFNNKWWLQAWSFNTIRNEKGFVEFVNSLSE